MYKLVKNKENGAFDVFEEATSQVVASFTEHKEAHKLYRRFSGGQGFGGWTPAFMLYGKYTFKG